METFWLFLVCVTTIHIARGYSLTATGKEVANGKETVNGKETLVQDAVKEYVMHIVTELKAMHDRDIHQLRDSVDIQLKQIADLEADKARYRSVISQLGNRIASLELVIETNAYDKEREVKLDTVKHSAHNLFQRKTFEDIDNTTEKSWSAGQLGTNLGNGRRVRRAITEGRVAFSASMTQDQTHLGQGQDIAFDHVITNIGNAYNSHHGTFLAPVGGIYVFYFSLHSPGARADLVVNGSVIANLYIGNDQASQLAIVSLKQGDDVAVQNAQSDKLFWGNYYSTFSGFLLFEADDNAQIVG